jgi:DNA-binding Lrp family transcriptional regulator
MDKLDLLILTELMEDGQTPFSRIAQKIGVSPDTVAKRYEKIKKKWNLSNNVTINPKKLGFSAIVYLLIRIEPNRDRLEMINELKKMPYIYMITQITGEFNLFSYTVVRDLHEHTNIINTIKNLPGVERVEFLLTEDFTLYNRTRYEEFKAYLERNLTSGNI